MTIDTVANVKKQHEVNVGEYTCLIFVCTTSSSEYCKFHRLNFCLDKHLSLFF